MNRIERYLKRLMQLSWLVTLISTLAAFFYSYDDISPLVTFAAFSWAASVCLSILYVVIAVSSAYFSNQRLPYRTMSVFIAAFVLIGILIYLGTIGVSFQGMRFRFGPFGFRSMTRYLQYRIAFSISYRRAARGAVRAELPQKSDMIRNRRNHTGRLGTWNRHWHNPRTHSSSAVTCLELLVVISSIAGIVIGAKVSYDYGILWAIAGAIFGYIAGIVFGFICFFLLLLLTEYPKRFGRSKRKD